MDQQLADTVAQEYEQWTVSGDRSVLTLFSPGLLDHVSGQRGLQIFDVVAAWLDEVSLAGGWSIMRRCSTVIAS